MLETIINAAKWILISLIALSALGLVHQLVDLIKANMAHQLTATLTRRVISHLITELHNGYDFKPYTMKHALQIFTHQLTDLLMQNGFNPRDYNAEVLVKAILTESHMLEELSTLLERRRQTDECPDSTSTQPTAHT